MKYNKKIGKLLLNKQNCNCISTEDQYNKDMVGTSSPSINLTNNQMISHAVKNARGKKTVFGNNGPILLNYLGQIEGMPGGTSLPPKNFY